MDFIETMRNTLRQEGLPTEGLSKRDWLPAWRELATTVTPTPAPGTPAPPLHPGSFVTWHRGDGSTQEGFVDFLHTDQNGKEWAFVSFGKSWAAVNVKFLTKVVNP